MPLSFPPSHWPRRSAAVAGRRGANPARRSAPQDSAWKRRRREVLRLLERFLRALRSGSPPPGPAPPAWGRFLSCCAEQGPLPGRDGGGAGVRPLCVVLDDNFYYRSMRYEVFQLARECNSCSAPPAGRGSSGASCFVSAGGSGVALGGWQEGWTFPAGQPLPPVYTCTGAAHGLSLVSELTVAALKKHCFVAESLLCQTVLCPLYLL